MNTEERFERIENAIRDLINVSRTLVTSIEELRESQKHTDERLNVLVAVVDKGFAELRQSQKHTDEKLSALIDTVDRIVRSWQKPNGSP